MRKTSAKIEPLKHKNSVFDRFFTRQMSRLYFW